MSVHNSRPTRGDPPALLAIVVLCIVGGYLLCPPTASLSSGIAVLGETAKANPMKMWVLVITTLMNLFFISSWLVRTLGFKKQGSRLSSLTDSKGQI